MSQKVEKENEVDSFTIVKEGQSPKLSPKSESFLEYQIAYKEDDQDFYIRISKNSSSGLFSNNWVRLEAIFTLLDGQVGKTLKSVALKPVITGGSSNSCGFLAAILRTISILYPIMCSYIRCLSAMKW
ncbi:hypothetical protein [Vibrio sp. S12_S33]|uniref:hypothetical protein n=1 Tax=Vibrio sp. S12_S33 TaxID=2720223 RepID=UPI001EE3224A|nr:hypothetical protein [Vibrio sp. S12_S33]